VISLLKIKPGNVKQIIIFCEDRPVAVICHWSLSILKQTKNVRVFFMLTFFIKERSTNIRISYNVPHIHMRMSLMVFKEVRYKTDQKIEVVVVVAAAAAAVVVVVACIVVHLNQL
jgi:hypothetical protein